MIYQPLKYSYNWNHKLGCDVFTTLRVHNSTLYKEGLMKSVYLKDNKYGTKKFEGDKDSYNWCGDARIVAVSTLEFNQINSAIALLDSGYELPEFRRVIMKMYPKYIDKHGDKALFDLVYVQYTKKHELLHQGINLINEAIASILKKQPNPKTAA